MTAWEVTASLDKARFALGESVPLAIEALCLGPGMTFAPHLSGGKARGPTLRVKRDGEAAILVTTARVDVSVPRTGDLPVGPGNRVTGELELDEWLEPLVPGSYEVAVLLKDEDGESKPVSFVVEQLRPSRFVAAAPDSTGTGEKNFLRIEPRPAGAVAVFTLPADERDTAIDLGPIDPLAEVALSVQPPGGLEVGRWFVSLARGQLAREFLGGEKGLAPIPVALGSAQLAGAFAGRAARPVLPAPGPGGEPVRFPAHVEWPELHVALFGVGPDGKPALVLISAPPDATREASVLTVTLERAPVAGCGVALSEKERAIFLAFQEGQVISVLAFAWSDGAVGEGRLFLSGEGDLCGIDAIHDLGRKAAHAAIVYENRRTAELGTTSAAVGGVAVYRSMKLADLPEGPFNFRVRVAQKDKVHVLAAGPVRLLIDVEQRRATPLEVDGASWDVELRGAGVGVVELDPYRGFVRTFVPLAAPVRG